MVRTSEFAFSAIAFLLMFECLSGGVTDNSIAITTFEPKINVTCIATSRRSLGTHRRARKAPNRTKRKIVTFYGQTTIALLFRNALSSFFRTTECTRVAICIRKGC